MKYKRIALIVIVISLIITFVGCSSANKDSSLESSSSSNQESSFVASTTKETTKTTTEATTTAPTPLTWSKSKLASLLPKPNAKYGEIISDEDEYFIAEIYQFSSNDFQSYEKACIEKGFTVDAEKQDDSYYAKNKGGETLTIIYENNQMTIELESAKYDVEIEASCDENLIFSKYDIEVYIDDNWIGKIDHGDSKTFSEPLKKGTHTILFKSSEDSDLTGTAEVNINSSTKLKYELHCTMFGIEVTDKSEKTTSEQETKASEAKPKESSKAESNSEQGTLTIDNNADFASLMSMENSTDTAKIKSFVNSHKKATIRFDGCIAFMMPHGSYKTRFDVCMAGGNYDADKVYGPLFSFEDVNFSDMHVSGTDTVTQGMNFTITAKIEGFSDAGNCIVLEPVKLKSR